jgi:hypothetical protein
MESFAVVGIMGAASVALAGAAVLTNQLNKSADIPAPEPEPEILPTPPSAPEPEPKVEILPAAEPVPEPVVEAAPEPVAEPEPPMAGGAIGQPPWGNISSTPLPRLTTGLTDVVGLPPNPRDLQIELTDLNDELENAQLRAYQANSEVKKILEFDYKAILQKYAVAYSKSEGAKKKQENALKILNAKPGKKDKGVLGTLKARLTSTKPADADKDEIRRLIAEEEAKPDESLKPKDLEDAAEKYEALVKDRVSADFELEELKRDKNERDTKVAELRKVEDGENGKVKELRAKRDALLLKVNQLNQPTRKLPLDWDARRKRYADATAGYSLAEARFRTFYTETWIPSEYDAERESKYGSRLNVLKKALDAAKVELDRARVGLTAPEQAVESMARDDIDEFVEAAKAFFGSEYAPGIGKKLPPNMTRYLPVLQVARKFDSGFRKLADAYYELAGMDETIDVLKGLDRLLVSFREFKNQDTEIKKYISEKLGAAIPVGVYSDPLPTEIDPAKNTALQAATTKFVNKQFTNIRQATAVILQAKKETRVDTGKTVKNLQELKDIVEDLFSGVPEALGANQCEAVMTPESFSAFSKNEFNGNSITTILAGTDAALKNAFFRKFLIRKITNLAEAQKYLDDLNAIAPPAPPSIINAATELVRRAGLVGAAAEADPFESGFYIRTTRSIDNIKFVLGACSVEKNLTKRAEVTNIRKILEMISNIPISNKPENPLDALIIRLEAERKILTRADQGVLIARANTVGFPRFNPSPSIVEVNDKNAELNAMETFLTFRSSKFISISPDDTTLYGGKTENTRDLYARLAFDVLKGLPAFRDWNNVVDDAFFQTRLARQFNLNFVILDEVSGNIIPMASQRPDTNSYFIFKRNDGKFFPVRFGDPADSVVRPAPFGGALDGGLRYIPQQVVGGWHRRTISWQRSKPSRLTRRKI